MLTDKLNHARQCLNQDRQARRGDPMHIHIVSSDEEEEIVPARVALPALAPGAAEGPSPPKSPARTARLPGIPPNTTVPPTDDLTLSHGLPTTDPPSAIIRNSTNVGNIDWANLVAASLTDPNSPLGFLSNTIAAPALDLQNMGQIFTDDAAQKNSLEIDTKVFPNAILHMAHNKIFIPLSLLTTNTLD